MSTPATVTEAATAHLAAVKEWQGALSEVRLAKLDLQKADTRLQLAKKRMAAASADYERLIGVETAAEVEATS